ncbi:MAG: uroporphyrinogen-III synthase [Blastochloris sp.]|nr:uroporphyrinogen-III synthase [Blastochloris sp.]
MPPPADTSAFDAALARLVAGEFDWLVLTSATAARAVYDRLAALEHIDAYSMPIINIAAVGASTAALCTELLGIAPAIVPDTFIAEALAAALSDQITGQRVLLANADIARPVLQTQLEAAGAVVERVIAYHTVPATGGADVPRLLLDGQLDALTFTSGSTVRYFVKRIEREQADPAPVLAAARRRVIACIGPQTAEAAEAFGLVPAVVAAPSTVEGLVAGLAHYAAQRR